MDPQAIIDLVHRRDALIARRDELIRDVQLEIDGIDEALGNLRPAHGVVMARGVAISHPPAGAPQSPPSVFRTKSEHLIDIISKSHEEPLNYSNVAKEVYGSDSDDAKGRLRSALSSLSHSGRIASSGRNRWRVV